MIDGIVNIQPISTDLFFNTPRAGPPPYGLGGPVFGTFFQKMPFFRCFLAGHVRYSACYAKYDWHTPYSGSFEVLDDSQRYWGGEKSVFSPVFMTQIYSKFDKFQPNVPFSGPSGPSSVKLSCFC